MQNYKLRDAKKVETYPSGSGIQKEEYYQKLEFTSQQLPELMLWKPGEDYMIVLKVRQTKYELEKEAKTSEECGYFDVLAVAALEPEYAEATKTVMSKLHMEE